MCSMRNYKGSMSPFRTLIWTNEIIVFVIIRTVVTRFLGDHLEDRRDSCRTRAERGFYGVPEGF